MNVPYNFGTGNFTSGDEILEKCLAARRQRASSCARNPSSSFSGHPRRWEPRRGRDAQVAAGRVHRRGQTLPAEVRGRRRPHRDRQVGRHLRDVRRRSRLLLPGLEGARREGAVDRDLPRPDEADRPVRRPAPDADRLSRSRRHFGGDASRRRFRTPSTTARISTSDTSRPVRTPRPCRSSSSITLVSRTCTSRIGS